MNNRDIDVTGYRDYFDAMIGLQTSTIHGDANHFMAPKYREMFGPSLENWEPPTEDDLRVHLLKRWPLEKVDALMERRRAEELERQQREAWEASLRGRITLRYRANRRESSDRIQGAWAVLRHGVPEDWDE